jgi:hypothetical protein
METMQLKTAKDVMAVARDRGLEFRLDPGPPVMPVLHYKDAAGKANVTPALRGACTAFREEIIKELEEERRAAPWKTLAGDNDP